MYIFFDASALGIIESGLRLTRGNANTIFRLQVRIRLDWKQWPWCPLWGLLLKLQKRFAEDSQTMNASVVGIGLTKPRYGPSRNICIVYKHVPVGINRGQKKRPAVAGRRFSDHSIICLVRVGFNYLS